MKLALVVLLVVIGLYGVSARPSIKSNEQLRNESNADDDDDNNDIDTYDDLDDKDLALPKSEFANLDPMLNYNLLEGDIKLSEGQENQLNSYFRTVSRKWAKRRIIYTLDSGYTKAQKQVIRQGMRQIVNQTANGTTKCIRFALRDATRHAGLPYVAIKSLSGCWSYVGRITENSSQDLSLLAPATPTSGHCIYKGTVMHELLHALGFMHEQTREDRDNYVTVNYNNMNANVYSNFDKAPLSQNSYMDTPYDYYSIMHYDSYAFSNNGQPTIVPKDSSVTLVHSAYKTQLTVSDVAAIRKAYDCK